MVESFPGTGSDGSQTALVARLRRLHERGAPLNLAYARRRFPAMVRAAFAPRASGPPPGWIATLRQARIDPAHIRMRFEPVCVCLECSFEAPLLTSHLINRHELLPRDYRRLHPRAEIMSEQLRARRMKPSSLAPHWDLIHTPEYCLDRLLEFRRLGFPIHAVWVAQHEPGLAWAVRQYLGSWDAALTQLDLDPARVRKAAPRETFSDGALRQFVRERRRAGLPLDWKSARTADPALVRAAQRRWRGWNAFLAAQGIDPARAAQWHRVSDHERATLLAELQRLPACEPAQRTRAARTIHGRYDSRIQSLFGSWSRAARAAGLPAWIVSTTHYPSRTSIRAELQRRARHHLPLRPRAIFDEDRALYAAIRRQFGNVARYLRRAERTAGAAPKMPRA